MTLNFALNGAQLKVFSSICADLIVVWVVATFATNGTMIIIRNIILIIFLWILAVKSEQKSRNYE